MAGTREIDVTPPRTAKSDAELLLYLADNFARIKELIDDLTGVSPGAHAASHENGGADEINVAGLSGVLADPQTPASHTHVEADITDFGSYSPIGHNHALSALSDVTITSLTSGEIIAWSGAAWINRTLAEAGIAAASHTHTEAEIIDLQNYSLVGHTHVEEDIVDLQNYALASHTHAMDDLTDVTITAIAANEVLQWDGAGWINRTLAEAGISATTHSHAIDDLSDVTLTALGDDEILVSSGGVWINKTFSEAGILTSGSFDLDDLSDVTMIIPGSGEVLVYSGAGFWWNQTLAEAGIAEASHTHSYAMDDLSDVTITAIASGELVMWNGSAFVNRTQAEAGIWGTGNIPDLTDLGDIDTGGLSNNDILYFDGGQWAVRSLQAHFDLHVSVTLSALDGVSITGITDNEILQYDSGSGQWINQTLAEAGIAAASHTHAHTAITDFDTEVNALIAAQVGVTVQAYDAQLLSLAGLSYTGNGLKVVRVNAAADAFELAAPAGDPNFVGEDTGATPSATGTDSVAVGPSAEATLVGAHAEANGQFAAAGDAQRLRFVCRGSTTNATPTELNPDGGSTSRLQPPAGSSWNMRAIIVARTNSNQYSVLEIIGNVKRSAAGTIAGSIGANKTIVHYREGFDAQNLDAYFSVNGTDDLIEIFVVGKASTTIRWVATLDVTQVKYA